MPFKVTYSGLNSNQAPKSPWADITPYVSVDENRNWASDRIFYDHSVTLNGQLTQSGFNALSSSPNSYGYSSDPTTNLVFPTGYIKIIKDSFSSCYGELIATDENDKTIISGTYYVDSINFNSQNFIGALTYDVNLKRYSDLRYSGINPSENISFSEDGNGIINITHSISAEGVGNAFNGNTSEAFNSVKTFVQDHTGASRVKNLSFGSGFVPTGSGHSGVFVENGNSSNLILVSQVENINRLSNEYSIEEVFKIDNLRNNSHAIKRFSTDISSGIQEDYLNVNVTCDIEGNKNSSFANISGLLNNITGEMYTVATGSLSGLGVTLCQTPIAFNINTNRLITGYLDGTNINPIDGSSKINVTCSFDNSLNGTFLDYDISYDVDEIQDTISLNLNGTIKGRGIHAQQKLADASGYLFTTLLSNQQDLKEMLYNKAISGFNAIAPNSFLYEDTAGILAERGGASFGFNKDKGEVSVSYNPYKGEISLTASFSDEASVSGYSDFNWNSSARMGLPANVIKQSCYTNGYNIIQDLQVNQRNEYDFNGSFSFVSGISNIPILSAANKPHTGMIKKLLDAEFFPDLSNTNPASGQSNAVTYGVTIDDKSMNQTVVSGEQISSNDYLSSGFSISASRHKIEESDLKTYLLFKNE